MDVLVTLKINDENGNLLHIERQAVSDDMGYSLDELIEKYGEHIEEFLLNQVELGEEDCGTVILRYHYLALSDDFDEDDQDEEEGESDEQDDEDNQDEELITVYDDGAIKYDLSLTNERIFVRFGEVHLKDED